MRRIRGAAGIGLTWAAGWAIGGVLLGVTSNILPWLPWDRFFEVFDAPLPALAIPGFVGGVLFSIVLGIAGRGRRFDELSLPRFAGWGALGGLLLGLTPAALAGIGLLDVREGELGIWQLTGVISAPFIVLSALSAAGSLMLARKAEGPKSIAPGGDIGELDQGSPAAAVGERARPQPTSRGTSI